MANVTNNAGDNTTPGSLGAAAATAETTINFDNIDGQTINLTQSPSFTAGATTTLNLTSGTGIATAGDLLARLFDDGGGNTVLDLGGGNSATLVGITASQLTTDSFLIGRRAMQRVRKTEPPDAPAGTTHAFLGSLHRK